jgi:hypothetical protein
VERLLYFPRIFVPALLFASLAAHAQTAQTPAPAQPTTPHGEVLFQSHGQPPTTPDNTTAPALQHAEPTGPALTDAQRSSLFFTAYDLDARLTPETSRLAMRARLTLRNIGSQPLTRIALQISSTLLWESAALIAPNATIQLPLTQHPIETDADHTGKVSEAVLDLPSPLAPGATLTLDTVYSGTISPDATRLERIGASSGQALSTDWDAIGAGPVSSSRSSDSSSPGPTPSAFDAALRGFGNVLWYPVAAPQLFLGDGAKLFQAIGQQRFTEQSASIHLRIAVEYKGDPPLAVYFCGRRQPLVAHADDPTAPLASRSGIATADFPAAPLGFRQPSLFVIDVPESLIAPLPQAIFSSSPAPSTTADTSPTSGGALMLAVETTGTAVLPRLAASAERIAPLLQRWFGPRPLTPLTVLDHPGDPFEDGPLLVAPIDALASTTSTEALAHSLTHAWVQTGQPWFDEGLAQFISLLWTEQEQGRPAAILQLNNLIQPLNLAEPAFNPPANPSAPDPSAPEPSSGLPSGPQDAASEPIGQPLVSASNELYYRRKAAAVWWMLRDITGDKPLQQALTGWRTQSSQSHGAFSHDNATIQAIAFEKLLEKTSGKDLGWFFSDWVLRDRGLPDLSIVDVVPRLLPAGNGHDSGWLVAVTVHNDGAPAVEVPLTVLSGALSITTRIHIPGFSNVTDRVLIEAAPTQVILNDGSTPEIRAATHTRDVAVQKDQPFSNN